MIGLRRRRLLLLSCISCSNAIIKLEEKKQVAAAGSGCLTARITGNRKRDPNADSYTFM